MKNERTNTIYQKARAMVRDNERVRSLLHDAGQKLGAVLADQKKLNALVDGVKLFIRMISSYFSGEYRAFSTKTVVFLVFGLLYFVTPVDMIPDFIPALGFADDLSIIYYIIRSFTEDIQAYREWENTIDIG